MARLSTVTTTHNEAAHIARALASVNNLTDEIIVIDSGSTDRTVEITQTFTPHVIRASWRGHGPQKNIGLEAATGDWVLCIDADEEVTAELAADIRRFLATDDPRLTTAFVRIITVFLGRPLRHLWGTNPRLFRRGAVRWDDRKVHEQAVRATGSRVRLQESDTVLLTHPLMHPSHYRTIAAYLERRERYTSQDAEAMFTTGQDRLGKPVLVNPRSPLSVARFLTERAAKQFIRLFVKKRGFLDGWQGWLWCVLSAQYEYLMCRKYLQFRQGAHTHSHNFDISK